MRWPWVSREQYDAKAKEAADWSLLASDYCARFDNLSVKYDALLRDHLLYLTTPRTPSVAPTPAPLPEAPKRELSVIDAVIRLEAKGDTRLARYFRSRAKTLQEEHPQWSDQEVATELSRWETAEEMPPEFLVGERTVTPAEQVG